MKRNIVDVDENMTHHIIEYLEKVSPSKRTAAMISKTFSYDKKIVNQILYKLEETRNDIHHDSHLPPRWWLWSHPESPQNELSKTNVYLTTENAIEAYKLPPPRLRTMVYIDLGNIHDSFQEACRYAKNVENIYVTGAADPNYNHWIPGEKLRTMNNSNSTMYVEPPKIRYFKANQPLKDAAELMLFGVALSDIIHNGPHIFQILLCSKDNAVDTMRNILDNHFIQSRDIEVYLCRNWNELHQHLRLLE